MICIKRALPLGLALIFCWTGLLYADYTIVLKNGRRITVKNYREEGGMIKVRGMGGEFGIAKEQIESILRAEETEGRGMDLPSVEQTLRGSIGVRQEEKKVARRGPEQKVKEKKEESVATKDKVLTPEERRAEERAKEEKEYQKRVREITERIEAMRARDATIKGSTNPKPSRTSWMSGSRLISPEEASRLVADKGGKLSGLRKQIIQLKKERKKLIQEMKQKNFDTGSFLLVE